MKRFVSRITASWLGACLPENFHPKHGRVDGSLVHLPDSGDLLVLCVRAYRLHTLNKPTSLYMFVSGTLPVDGENFGQVSP
jgi:hypothetical protein